MQMAESNVNVMQERINEWKKAHKDKPRDLDYGMFCDVLDIVNESSVLKVARNPLDEDRDWVPDTVCHNVRGFEVDDQGRLVIILSRDHAELTVESAYAKLRGLKKHAPAKSNSVMVRVSDTKVVQLTDVYSHALVKDSWAGLPFDVVFAYYEED